MRRRGRHLRQPHPQGSDSGKRSQSLDRRRQSAQRRGAQRRADRRISRQSQLIEGCIMANCYWIARVDVSDPETYKKYVETAMPAFKRYNAKFLARGGKTEVLEGKARARNVIIEFASMEDAHACY